MLLKWLPRACFIRGFASAPASGIVSRCSNENNVKKKVAVILGWSYSHDEHVAKYAELHKRLGLDTIRFTMPMPYLFNNDQEKQVEYVKENYESFKAQFGTEVVLIFHCFSHNGFNHMGHLESLMKHEKGIKIKGVIMDSCPRQFTLFNWMFIPPNGLWGLNAKNSWQMLPIGYFTLVFMTQNYGFKRALEASYQIYKDLKHNWKHNWPLVDPDAHILYNSKLEAPTDCPVLYCFANWDLLAPTYGIMGSIAKQQREGRKVISRLFKNSPHVGHYKKYPKEYEEAVRELLKLT